jgi:hypothetical protein
VVKGQPGAQEALRLNFQKLNPFNPSCQSSNMDCRFILTWNSNISEWLKGSLVHIAPTCTGSREGSNHFGSYVHNISLHFCERLFPELEIFQSGYNEEIILTQCPLQLEQLP